MTNKHFGHAYLGIITERWPAVCLYWDRYARPSLTLPWRETSMQLTRDFQIVGARSLGLWPLHLESPLAFRYVGQFKFQFIDTVRFKHQENLLLVFLCNTTLNSVDHRWKKVCQIVSQRDVIDIWGINLAFVCYLLFSVLYLMLMPTHRERCHDKGSEYPTSIFAKMTLPPPFSSRLLNFPF